MQVIQSLFSIGSDLNMVHDLMVFQSQLDQLDVVGVVFH